MLNRGRLGRRPGQEERFDNIRSLFRTGNLAGTEHGPVVNAGRQGESRHKANRPVGDPIFTEKGRPFRGIGAVGRLDINREQGSPIVRLPIDMRQGLHGVCGQSRHVHRLAAVADFNSGAGERKRRYRDER